MIGEYILIGQDSVRQVAIYEGPYNRVSIEKFIAGLEKPGFIEYSNITFVAMKVVDHREQPNKALYSVKYSTPSLGG